MLSEPLLAICLGLFSAVTLATANMSVKMGSDILVGRAILSASSALLIAPAALFVPLPDARLWGALLLTIPAHYAYQLCLIRALQRGDLSLVFPVMRGAAPLLTAVTALLLLGEHLAPWAWLGLLVATGALILFALPPRGVLLRHHPDRAALGWAAATALGIAFYNTLDARGVRLAEDPFSFIVWLFLLDSILITATALIFRRGAYAAALAIRWRYGVAAGILSLLSFGSALYAFTLMETAKVSALRETSVIFAAAMGAYWLGEGFGGRRLVAAVLLALGLVLMQFAG